MTLIYILAGIMLFSAVVVNSKNAHYLLAGYNTLPESKKSTFDLVRFLKFFKNFLFLLALSYLVIGLILHNVVRSENGLMVFAVMYPLFGFLILIFNSLKFYGSTRKSTILLIFIGGGVILAVMISIGIGMSKPNIKVEVEQLHISGPYGTKISYQDIVGIEKITMPTHPKKIEGFQLGAVRKGRFALFNNEMVTIISTTDSAEHLMIVTHAGKYIIEYDSLVENQIIDKLKK